MSETSSKSSNDKNIKQVNFSTDYMVSLLKNSDKLKPEDVIQHYTKDHHSDKIEKKDENNDDESMSEYINNKNDFNNNFFEKKLGNKYIKVYEDLCDKKKCYFGANDQIFFKDGNHLSNEGLRKLTKTKNQIEVILNRN